MKTNYLVLSTRTIRTHSLWAQWYENDQMRWHIELKDDKRHGDSKWWSIYGRLWSYYVYENGELVKRIV